MNEIDKINSKILNKQIDIANRQSQIDALRSANQTDQEIINEYEKHKAFLEELEGGVKG